MTDKSLENGWWAREKSNFPAISTSCDQGAGLSAPLSPSDNFDELPHPAKHFRYRPKPMVTHCVTRDGYLRRRVEGVNCWRASSFREIGRRWEPYPGVIRQFWAPIICRRPWHKFRNPHEAFVLWMLCFACGQPQRLQRAHIAPRWRGGADEAINLHMLCPQCHVESESLPSAMAYWHWFARKPSQSEKFVDAARQYIQELKTEFRAEEARRSA